MLRLINIKKHTVHVLIGILLASGIIVQSGNKQAVAAEGVQGIELRYEESAFQCGVSDNRQADIKVEIYDKLNNNLLTTLSKGDVYTTADFDSLSELGFKYKIYNFSHCNMPDGSTRGVRGSMLLGANDLVPDVAGFSGQSSVGQIHSSLDSYEELFLVELGTSNITSSTYDLQDIVLVVDNNPDSLNPDDGGDGDYDKNGIPDSRETEGDFDKNGIDNFQDPDDDGDGIPDVMELYPSSEIDLSDVNDVAFKPDANAPETTISLPIAPVNNFTHAQALNTYEETSANYQNIDSDGDYIKDQHEAGDNNLATPPVNTDGDFAKGSDSVPDYLDLDSDADSISDQDEAGDNDLDSAPDNSDSSNGDSIADFRDLDSDDNGILDQNEVDSDVDGDGTKNFQDLDDDGDNIVDIVEIGSDAANPTNSDNDSGDGYDYQDTDSDNDGLLDVNEGIKSPSTSTTAIGVAYPTSNGSPTTYNLQDYNEDDTINSDDNLTLMEMTIETIPNGNGTVKVTGTMEGLDYQTKTPAD